MMMRAPEQDRKVAMLGRLPEVARILRTFFVTMKKPAIPLEDAVEKVSDSYRSCMGKCKYTDLQFVEFTEASLGQVCSTSSVH